eukprot:332917_1
MENMTVLQILNSLGSVRSNACPELFKDKFVKEESKDDDGDIGRDCDGDYGRDCDDDAQDGAFMRNENELLDQARVAQSHINEIQDSYDADLPSSQDEDPGSD